MNEMSKNEFQELLDAMKKDKEKSFQKKFWSPPSDKEGTFKIRVRAKDTFGAFSDWGELSVTMPRNRVVNNLFLYFLEKHPILYQLLQRLIGF